MENLIKKRTVRLDKSITQSKADSLQNELLKLNGLLNVDFKSPAALLISYDLMQVNLDEIEKKIQNASFDLLQGFFRRFSRGWIHFTEENERNNIKAVPQSCCEVPEKH